ncbi:hypothetical protein D1AOALGA4SA_1833 [Olavius algarvensis Delta 1 endosymbiont]|nr:hypothetical protein D1AOALGA4SA_1833 [Olavius algarvensis Delta 1 endosymbiont]
MVADGCKFQYTNNKYQTNPKLQIQNFKPMMKSYNVLVTPGYPPSRV